MSININDPWNRGDDPLGNIANAIDTCKKSDKQRVYMMVAPDRMPECIPVFKELNNKPWYQQSKGRRRSY